VCDVAQKGDNMKLIINDTEYNFRFGIGFVRHLDGESSIRQNGITFGVGLESMVTKLTMKDTVALSDTLAAANMTECPRVQTADIDQYIDDETTDIEGLFDKVIDELKKSNATRLKTEEILKTIEEEARAEKAKTEESDKE
jgi:A2 protein